MKKIIKLVVILLLPLTLLLTTVEAITFDVDYFDRKYEEYDISKKTGIDDSDLTDITEKLLGYLNDDTDNLKITKSINGKQQQVFGEREVLHMVDVKELFLSGRNIKNISFVIVLLSLIYLFIKDKKSIGNTLILSSVTSISVIGLLSVLMYVDFNKYFTYFHEIFFSNDLWLLNPDTDVLIQMLPIEFFYSIATKIASVFILELVILVVVGIFMNKKDFH